MNVLLISQCHKRALTETRRVIDQFAERCGDRTWQTAITREGLRHYVNCYVKQREKIPLLPAIGREERIIPNCFG